MAGACNIVTRMCSSTPSPIRKFRKMNRRQRARQRLLDKMGFWFSGIVVLVCAVAFLCAIIPPTLEPWHDWGGKNSNRAYYGSTRTTELKLKKKQEKELGRQWSTVRLRLYTGLLDRLDVVGDFESIQTALFGGYSQLEEWYGVFSDIPTDMPNSHALPSGTQTRALRPDPFFAGSSPHHPIVGEKLAGRAGTTMADMDRAFNVEFGRIATIRGWENCEGQGMESGGMWWGDNEKTDQTSCCFGQNVQDSFGLGTKRYCDFSDCLRGEKCQRKCGQQQTKDSVALAALSALLSGIWTWVRLWSSYDVAVDLPVLKPNTTTTATILSGYSGDSAALIPRQMLLPGSNCFAVRAGMLSLALLIQVWFSLQDLAWEVVDFCRSDRFLVASLVRSYKRVLSSWGSWAASQPRWKVGFVMILWIIADLVIVELILRCDQANEDGSTRDVSLGAKGTSSSNTTPPLKSRKRSKPRHKRRRSRGSAKKEEEEFCGLRTVHVLKEFYQWVSPFGPLLQVVRARMKAAREEILDVCRRVHNKFNRKSKAGVSSQVVASGETFLNQEKKNSSPNLNPGQDRGASSDGTPSGPNQRSQNHQQESVIHEATSLSVSFPRVSVEGTVGDVAVDDGNGEETARLDLRCRHNCSQLSLSSADLSSSFRQQRDTAVETNESDGKASDDSHVCPFPLSPPKPIRESGVSMLGCPFASQWNCQSIASHQKEGSASDRSASREAWAAQKGQIERQVKLPRVPSITKETGGSTNSDSLLPIPAPKKRSKRRRGKKATKSDCSSHLSEWDKRDAGSLLAEGGGRNGREKQTKTEKKDSQHPKCRAPPVPTDDQRREAFSRLRQWQMQQVAKILAKRRAAACTGPSEGQKSNSNGENAWLAPMAPSSGTPCTKSLWLDAPLRSAAEGRMTPRHSGIEAEMGAALPSEDEMQGCDLLLSSLLDDDDEDDSDNTVHANDARNGRNGKNSTSLQQPVGLPFLNIPVVGEGSYCHANGKQEAECLPNGGGDAYENEKCVASCSSLSWSFHHSSCPSSPQCGLTKCGVTSAWGSNTATDGGSNCSKKAARQQKQGSGAISCGVSGVAPWSYARLPFLGSGESFGCDGHSLELNSQGTAATASWGSSDSSCVQEGSMW